MRRSSLITALSVIGFFAIFSTTISKNPVLPLFSQALGAGEVTIGLIAAVSPAAGILFSFPVGVLADRIGAKRLLTGSALVFLTAPLLYLFVADPLWLIPVRFFHGLATAILGPVASITIYTAYPEAKGEMSGIYSSATLVGRTAAPLAGGIILSASAAAAGLTAYHLVYGAAFLAAIPVLFLVLTLKDAPGDPAGAKGQTVSFTASLRGFLQSPPLLSTALVEMAAYFTFGIFETWLPLYLIAAGVQEYLIGLLFALQVVAVAVSKPFFGALSDQKGRRIQIVAGLLAEGGCIAAFAFTVAVPAVMAVGICFGLALSLVTVSTGAYIADLSDREHLGASIGALSAIMDIGHASGPLVAGAVIAIAGYAAGFFLPAVLAAGIAVVFIGAGRSAG
ncbi:major facilitator superfamily MFS_1 [Methanofollis liminatans DSM 4140]|uniref:Major facilitator superfamily MFS_1 n=1 Tax=Methanofollis liminatans DSM 4140 TaxID=28892 RepID=J1L501_9EURY|nr:MFS transporter [Methanofollis liminatans]EJG08212.1 major facilitator superfamily MFS_1 [Methanofollis liminatans DSM 4140]